MSISGDIRARSGLADTGAIGSLLVVCPHCDAVNRLARTRLAGSDYHRGKCGACNRHLFEGNPMRLEDEERLARHSQGGDLPLIIDFWAAWCGPCRQMTPIFHQAAAELEPGFRLAKVDTEAAPALAARFGIRSIPSIVILHRGREMARAAGVRPLQPLLDWAMPYSALAASV